MKLIVGLGNPGKKYENTRHNSGFLAMDYLAKKCNVSVFQEKWNALIAKVYIENEVVLLMKPLTYMNESGQAVIQAVNFYHIEPEDVLIMHDDMDLPVGSVRIRAKGSSGGQKGMQSIINHMHTNEIPRIRIGVGHDTTNGVIDWVLSPVDKVDQPKFQEALELSAQAAYAWAYEDFHLVMSKYNRKEKKHDKPEE